PELQCSAAGWTRPSGLRTRLTELPGSAAACIFERSRKPHNPSQDLGVLEQTSPGRWLTPRALMTGTRPQYLQFPHPWRAESPRRVCGVSVRLYFMRNVRRGEGSKVLQKRKKARRMTCLHPQCSRWLLRASTCLVRTPGLRCASAAARAAGLTRGLGRRPRDIFESRLQRYWSCAAAGSSLGTDTTFVGAGWLRRSTASAGASSALRRLT